MRYRRMILVSVCIVVALGCSTHSPYIDQSESSRHPGLQWLAWTQLERETFVFGFAQGLGSGAYLACRSADDLFERGQSHLIGHDNTPSTFPSARCRAKVDRYLNVPTKMSTGTGISQEAATVTAFYEEYPQYRDIEYINVISHLIAAQARTVDDLHVLAEAGKLSNLPE